jgi:hypothetical protein
MAATTEEIKKGEKVTFLARFLNERYLKEREAKGYHYYDKHINPMEVAPPRRDDGYTMCNYCDMNHLPWEKLSDEKRLCVIKKVELFQEAERAWNDQNY